MRAKVESDRSTGSEWLDVRLSSKERLDLNRLAWLRAGAHRYLLQVESQAVFDPGGLRYGVTGLESLRSFLKHYEITPFQYENILVSVGEALGMLRREGQPPDCLQFDDRYVFSDMDGNLWFVFLPVEKATDGKGRSPSEAFLRYLARARSINFSSGDDLDRSRRLRDALRKGEFSLDAYERFLVEEYGIRLDFSDAADGAAEPLPAMAGLGGVAGTPGAFGTAGAVPPTAPAGVAQHLRQRRDVPVTLSRREWDESVTRVATSPDVSQLSDERLADERHEPSAHGQVRDARPADGRPIPAGGGSRTTAFRLVALDGSGGSYALGDCSSVIVGRGSACDVRIPDNMRISRTHVRIEREEQGFRLTDLGSANGTFVRDTELRDGESGHVGLGETFELADVPMVIQGA